CDPWLEGKAFNDSWSLWPKPAWNPEWLSTIQAIWISHEHPDHFHIPTLRSLPAAFKARVRILFQRTNSDKLFAALKNMGFIHFEALPHRGIVTEGSRTHLYCYQEGAMNSCLAVIGDGHVLLNVNDAEIREGDCRLIRRDIGSCGSLLNQFSIAGYPGHVDHAPRLSALRKSILDNMVENHRSLGATVTI